MSKLLKLKKNGFFEFKNTCGLEQTQTLKQGDNRSRSEPNGFFGYCCHCLCKFNIYPIL